MSGVRPRHPDPRVEEQLVIARRAVLDHLLGLVAGAGWGERLVLRGSMAVLAWVGDAAREPADLDFVVLPPGKGPVERQDPHPHVEAGDGERDSFAPWDSLLELIRQQPVVAPGMTVHADGAVTDDSWGADYDGEDAIGVRLFVSWQAEGLPPAAVQIDFARNERIPEPPVWTLVPRQDGSAPTRVRTASRELSLAWKLLWLNVDAVGLGRPRCKDLYDAVLLAEDGRTRSPERLLRRLLADRADRDPAEDLVLEEVQISDTDWAAFRRQTPGVARGARSWLRRLAAALEAAAARGETPAG